MKHNCPVFSSDNEEEIEITMCDNNCRTIFCMICDKEFYEDSSNTIKIGHDPECGISSDDND